MKRPILLVLFLVLVLLNSQANAQTTVSFTLGPADEDATIDNFNPGSNYPNEIEYYMAGWTISGDPVAWRNLFKFNLNSISSTAVVQSATLSLYFAPNNSFGAQHSSLSHSNQCVLQQITSLWAENLVTWNNQPTVTTQDQVVIPQSTSPTQDYPNLDVTAMVQQMISDPPTNLGFMLSMVDETPYARMIFGSGDNPDPALRPVLTITYFEPCVFLTLDPIGEDAQIDNYNSSGFHPNEIEYFSGTWTISGTPTIWRNLFRFNLTTIPASAVIQDAKLSLYYATINNFSNAHHSSLTHSDESVIQRVTTAWQESFVTWNTQPTTTTQNQVVIPQTVSDTEDYPDIDVTALVQDMFADPQNSYGFELKATDETPYSRMIFASSDNPDVTKHPRLRICYYDPADISEMNSEKDIKVFPNPAREKFTVQTYGQFEQLSVLDQLGHKLIYKNISAGNNFEELNMTGFSPGVYFIVLSGDSKTKYGKIVVQN